jgi:hypothetical protein
MGDYCYYTRVLSDATPLPIDICDYILDFLDDTIPIASNKSNTPVGWFYYSLIYKPIKDVMHIEEIDMCKTCKGWAAECSTDVCKITQ